MKTEPGPRLVVITGLSGSGKSSVAKCFEDLGYYVVDNLPLPLLATFLENPSEQVEGHDRIAVVTDVRAPGFGDRFPALMAGLVGKLEPEPTLLFLESSDEALVRRFSETRRSHPMAADLALIEAIQREREVLAELRGQADMVFDTSEWTIHEVRRQVYAEFAPHDAADPAMTVSLVSFGFKHGIPYGSDLVFDVRYLPNPHFVPGLREKTGEDPEVQSFLGEQEEFGELIDRLSDLLLYLLPRYRRENRSYLSVAIGCTGGKHRSVASVIGLEERLRDAGWTVRLLHRDSGHW